jgi:hypothetical protein
MKLNYRRFGSLVTPEVDDDYLVDDEENEKPFRERSIWGFAPDYEYNVDDE